MELRNPLTPREGVLKSREVRPAARLPDTTSTSLPSARTAAPDIPLQGVRPGPTGTEAWETLPDPREHFLNARGDPAWIPRCPAY